MATLVASRYAPWVLEVLLDGSPVATAFPPSQHPLGTILDARDAGVVYLRDIDASGAARWIPVGGSAGAWPRYTVSAGDPAAAFSSIQAAIAAAAAAGGSAPVLVFPGTYAESLTLRDGVSVVALGAQSGGAGPTLLGSVTAALATASPVQVVGFVVLGGVAFAGAAAQDVAFLGCRIAQLGAGDAVAMTNGAPASRLAFVDCAVEVDPGGGAPGARALRMATPAALTARATSFAHVAAAVAVECEAGAAAGSFQLTDCVLTGALVTAAPGGYVGDRAVISAAGRAAVTLVGGVFSVGLQAATVDCDTDPAYDGVGALQRDAVRYTDKGGVAATLMTTLVTSVARPRVALLVAGPGPHAFPTTADVLFVATGGAPAAVALDFAAAGDGDARTVALAAAAGDVTVTDAGGANLNGAAAFVLLAGASGFTSVTFLKSVAAGQWLSVAR